jgi:hypothetical protein
MWPARLPAGFIEPLQSARLEEGSERPALDSRNQTRRLPPPDASRWSPPATSIFSSSWQRSGAGRRRRFSWRFPNLLSRPRPGRRRLGRSTSGASRTFIGLNSTLKDGATPCIAANSPRLAGLTASRRTAARVTRGSISLSNCSHFALMPYSNDVKPVVLPPGRARLATKPAPTGSTMPTNTIGTVRLTCCSAATFWLPETTTRSGASATSSCACLRTRSLSPAPPKRWSNWMLCPSLQPSCCSACRNRRCTRPYDSGGSAAARRRGDRIKMPFVAVRKSGNGSAPRRRESSVEEDSTRRVVD